MIGIIVVVTPQSRISPIPPTSVRVAETPVVVRRVVVVPVVIVGVFGRIRSIGSYDDRIVFYIDSVVSVFEIVDIGGCAKIFVFERYCVFIYYHIVDAIRQA